MEYETCHGNTVQYKFVENRLQLAELAPNNRTEEVIDYLLINGQTYRKILDLIFPSFHTRATEFNRASKSLQIIEIDGLVRLQRVEKINTARSYQSMYPNSNGKRRAGDDFSGPKSYYKI